MNTKEITPPDIVRVIFPIKGNEAQFKDASTSYEVKTYPSNNIILFEGSLADVNSLRSILIGGVIA